MLKLLQYILFRTALIIVTFHTIIPHPHSDELSNERHSALHSKSNTLIGLIRLVFHESNDEILDNLLFADYNSVKKVDNKYNYPFLSILNKTQSTYKRSGEEAIVKRTFSSLGSLFFVKQNGLRGPPAAT